MDALLDFDPDTLSADLALDGALLATDDSLRTAVVISLFSDARAAADDELSNPDGGRGGWWGDSLAEEPGDQVGSKLWLLTRAKATQATLTRAQEAAQAALEWMVADGVAKSVVAIAEWVRAGVLGLTVTITRPDGGVEAMRFNSLWEAL